MADGAYAEVTRVGRWTWRIVIKDGLTEYGPDCGWHVVGRERAQRRARRELGRYLSRAHPERFMVGDCGG